MFLGLLGKLLPSTLQDDAAKPIEAKIEIVLVPLPGEGGGMIEGTVSENGERLTGERGRITDLPSEIVDYSNLGLSAVQRRRPCPYQEYPKYVGDILVHSESEEADLLAAQSCGVPRN